MDGTRGGFFRHGLMASVAIVCVATATPAVAQTRSFNVSEQDAASGVAAFAKQADIQLLISARDANGKRTNAVRGNLTVEQGLQRLLADTGLRAQSTGAQTYSVVPSTVGNGPAAAEAASNGEGALIAEEGRSEILVIGRRTLNGDVRRTENDVQPYVVLSGEDIKRSGAVNVEDFLRTRLPMNQQHFSNAQDGTGIEGRVSLRGLGPDQTLILVDGRRVPGVGLSSAQGFGQPSLNGIPPSAIDRIEILPATAGGIYGGGATGGVINIILKRNFNGIDVEASYGDTFHRDAGNWNLNINGGFSIAKGTSLSFRASRSHQDSLDASDRDFFRRSQELAFKNRPSDFGAPPIGATPNICSFSSVTFACGSDTLVLDPVFGGQSLGSAIVSVPSGFRNLTAANASALLAAGGSYNFNPAKHQLTLYSAPSLQAYSATLRQKLGSNAEFFLDSSYSRSTFSDENANNGNLFLAASDPNNPFQQDILVAFAMPSVTIKRHRSLSTLGFRGGLIIQLPQNWSAAFEYSWNQDKAHTTEEGGVRFSRVTPYVSTIALTDLSSFPPDISQLNAPITIDNGPIKTQLRDAIARASGPLFSLPGGPVTLSGYLERREQVADPTITSTIAPGIANIFWFPEKSQDVNSAYAEIRGRVISPQNKTPLFNELELFGSLRYDHYTTHAAGGNGIALASVATPPPTTFAQQINKVSSTDFTLGLKYSPIQGITLRASYGTGFLPPNLGQLNGTTTLITDSNARFSIPSDPKRGGTRATTGFIQLSGGNADLKPEQSKSLSLGVVFEPVWVPNLRVSLDYTDIKKTNNIGSVGIAQLLLREDEFPGRIIRGPNLPTDPPGWAGPITQVDLSLFNFTRSRVRAFDAQLDYSLKTAWGSFSPYVIGTYQPELSSAVFVNDPFLNSVGFSNGPLRWRANFGLIWKYGPVTIGWDAQYYGRQKICQSSMQQVQCDSLVQLQGASKIPSQFYNDLSLTYKFEKMDNAWRALNNTTVRFGIQNLFDKSPPILATSTNSLFTREFDQYGDPRLRRFILSLDRSF